MHESTRLAEKQERKNGEMVWLGNSACVEESLWDWAESGFKASSREEESWHVFWGMFCIFGHVLLLILILYIHASETRAGEFMEWKSR